MGHQMSAHQLDPGTGTPAQPLTAFRLQDRFLTTMVSGDGEQLIFVVAEIYDDGTYGGALVRAGAPEAGPVDWIEELTTADLRAWRRVAPGSVEAFGLASPIHQ